MRRMAMTDRARIARVFIAGIVGLAVVVSGPSVRVAEGQAPGDKPRDSPTVESAPSEQAAEKPPSGEIQERGVLPPLGPTGPLSVAPGPLGFVDLFPFLFTINCSVIKYSAVPVQLLVAIGNVGTAVVHPTQDGGKV